VDSHSSPKKLYVSGKVVQCQAEKYERDVAANRYMGWPLTRRVGKKNTDFSQQPPVFTRPRSQFLIVKPQDGGDGWGQKKKQLWEQRINKKGHFSVNLYRAKQGLRIEINQVPEKGENKVKPGFIART